ncbi:A-kinase anchor protein 17A-like [Schistocerca nitens]|uniref:A-kinase anchor protein 17A-like n=1 Tax=Schistocerca nitens TaxID=7011 RepID=UPI00211800F7|nr:A-kinase anchor protein 17A-like [Schistocerca nitens]
MNQTKDDNLFDVNPYNIPNAAEMLKELMYYIPLWTAVMLEERDRERDQKLAQMLYEQEQQREQKEREKERMSEQREKQRDEKLAQMLREHEQRNEAKLDRIQSELAEMRDACKEIPDLVQSLASEMQKLQISQARLEDNVQTLTNRVDNVEIDARKSIDAYLEVQAQKVEKELNEWLEVKDREISAKVESDVKTAVEQATAAASNEHNIPIDRKHSYYFRPILE